MELRATSLGKHLAQHPYNRARLLPAGVEVSGDRHEYLIPFNQLLTINCKRGLVWGELEFVLLGDKVVRLHGTEWRATCQFFACLEQRWRQWSGEMSQIAGRVLAEQYYRIQALAEADQWLNSPQLTAVQQQVRSALAALPLPTERLNDFSDCRDNWAVCRYFLDQTEQWLLACRKRYIEHQRAEHADFFRHIVQGGLNLSQTEAVLKDEPAVLVLAGAGSGKSAVLVARAGWLLRKGLASADQILMLAFGRRAADNMTQRLAEYLPDAAVTVKTFHALALSIIEQSTKKKPIITPLEQDTAARQVWLTDVWQQQCQQKKAQAKGWRQWIEDELGWQIAQGDFWQDPRLAARMAIRLDSWLGLIRMQPGNRDAWIAAAPEGDKICFTQGLKLMSPLLTAWKRLLKETGHTDFTGLIHQAIQSLEKGRFISPWKAILVDEFQDISPLRATLLDRIRKQNCYSSLYAVGDDWQAVYRFSGAATSLTTQFRQHYPESSVCQLDTTYRFGTRLSEIATAFIERNPQQIKKHLQSGVMGDKQPVVLLADDKFERLLDKLSSYVTETERILVLARYQYLKPVCLDSAATRWPKLHIDFMTLHASKGQEADYVVILGLQEGDDGFPARERESVLERVLLPAEEAFPDAEERRLLYVGLTRAKKRVWLLFNRQVPSPFVNELASLGVPRQTRP